MADILETLMSIMCQQNTLSQCQNFIQQYPTVLEQTIYFFFFPTVFSILFVYVISDAVANNISKKFKVLIGVALFVFIVMQGWYHYMLILSRFWFFAIIILGGFYAIMNMGIRKSVGGGGSPVSQKALGSLGKFIKKRAAVGIRGDEESLHKKVMRERSQVEKLEERIKEAEKRNDDYAAGNLRHMKMMKMEEIEGFMMQLKEMTSFEGTKVGASKHLRGHKDWLDKHAKK